MGSSCGLSGVDDIFLQFAIEQMLDIGRFSAASTHIPAQQVLSSTSCGLHPLW